jgi:hypothetical protein
MDFRKMNLLSQVTHHDLQRKEQQANCLAAYAVL